MSEPFLGEIRTVGFNFAPTGWALCNGQTLSISQYTALFSLLGTTYGGNGTTTFNLPNLQSRVPIHQGQGAGLSPYVIGQNGGVENVTLLSNQMPLHNHNVNVNSQNGNQSNPSGMILAVGNTGGREPAVTLDYTNAAATGTLAPTAVSQSGGNVPHPNIQPYLTVNFIIALVGIFPSRS
ncbi:MAG: tail fiber protein [Terracidiphilus sp.]|jgi:microcystin-dependent protein